jgi:hypothetical protein
MTLERRLRIAVATITCAVVATPIALAAGEPKNEWPFARQVGESPRSLATTAVYPEPAGEPKNQWPFTRLVSDRAARSVAAAAASRTDVAGEPKNEAPFTGSVSTPAVVVQTSDGFDWGDAGIGAAASLGLAFIAVGASALLSANGRRPHESGA